MEYFCANNLRKEFENICIEASFECKKESFTCIVGSSGSGKSTILRLIAGLEKNSRVNTDEKIVYDTKIILDGNEIQNLPSAKRNVGMVFQNNALFDHLTVLDNVAYGLRSIGMKKKDARKTASEFLPSFGLEGFEKRYPDTLSGGEAQRVALARTLITKPKLLLLDEPLSALDAPLRKKLAVFLKDLQHKFKFTAIMVTHDLDEARQLADNIILIKKGEIYWQGKSEDFTEDLMDK